MCARSIYTYIYILETLPRARARYRFQLIIPAVYDRATSGIRASQQFSFPFSATTTTTASVYSYANTIIHTAHSAPTRDIFNAH